MNITTISSREFNQDTSGAKKAALRGPVVITDRGEPAHVLLNIKDYHKLAGEQPSIVRQLVMQGNGSAAFDPPRLRDGLLRNAEF